MALKKIILCVMILAMFGCVSEGKSGGNGGGSESGDDGGGTKQETTSSPDFFYKGADLSFVPEIERSGGFYLNENGEKEDILGILKRSGINCVRLRVWNNNGWCNVEKTVEMAKRVKEAGLRLFIDFHYSDTWADPAQQEKPKEWQGLGYDELQERVYLFTKEALERLKGADAMPDIVQVGNEVNGGFMWEEGRVNDNTSEKWAKFTGLLAKGIKAVREADKKIEVVIHVAGYKDAEWFYGKLGEYKIDYDIIGLSYYSWWHGSSLSDLRQTMNTISAKYGKRVIIAETAYPWTLGWNDYTNNIVGEEKQLIEGYPSDIDGQGKYIEKIIEITKGIDGSKGAGIFYWGGEYIAYRGKTATDGSTWENMALFDFGNKRLPSAGAFLK